MDKSIHNLMKETLPLLKEASEVMRASSKTGLAEKIDEAVVAIEKLVQSDEIDRHQINQVLEILGRGIALIPEIAKLLDLFKS